MLTGSTIFTRIMEFLPWRRFHTCVTRYQGNYKVKRFKCAEHFRMTPSAGKYCIERGKGGYTPLLIMRPAKTASRNKSTSPIHPQ